MMYLNLDVINLLVLLVAVVNAIYGLVVYSRNRSDATNRAFFILTLAVSFWGFSMFGFRATLDASLTTFFARLLYFAASVIPISFLYFVFIFPRPEFTHTWWQKYVLPVPFIFLSAFSLIPGLLIQTVVFAPGKENLIVFTQPLHIFYGVYIVSYFLWGYALLFGKYIRAEGTLRTQILFIFTGTFIATSIGVFTNLLLPLKGIFTFNWAGQIGVIVMIASIFYSILKYHLFNIRVIAAELFTFSLWVFILIRSITAVDLNEKIINGVLFLLVFVVGIFLIKSVRKEIETRERIELLAQDLEKANVRLRELDQQKSEFVSIASHQLRSPLTAIKGYASMVLEGSFGAIEPKVREAISRIFESSRNLTAVVEDLLNVTKIEQGGMQFIFDKVDMKKLVEEIVGELTPNVKRAGLSLHVGDNGHKTYYINADYVKIRQVVANLIDNAIKYTPKGGEISVFLSEDNEKGKTTFSVTDTGMGIEKEMQDRLFEKFSRASGISKVNTGGSGLGLYVAKEIVKSHGGLIWATSAGKGEGSTFSVELPEYDYHRQTEATAHFAETL